MKNNSKSRLNWDQFSSLNFPFSILNSQLSNGFSLIELLIVVALISILSVSSVAFYSRFLIQNAVANTSDQLTGELRKAQMYSMMGKQNSSWGVAYNSGKIILFQGNFFATRNTAFDESFSVNSNITVSGFSELVFAHAAGIPNITPTITITGNNSTKTVTINAMGVVNR